MLVNAFSKKIVINTKTTLGCNGYPNTCFENVSSDIEINAIRFYEDGQNYLILSVDTLFVTEKIREKILTYLLLETPLVKSNIFLCATHTHYAPFLDSKKPLLGKVNKSYLKTFYKALEEVIIYLFYKSNMVISELFLESLEFPSLTISRRKKNFSLRRGFLPWVKHSIYPNSKEKIDKKAHLICLKSKSTGRIKSIIWTFACHPVMFPSPKNLTSHFPGEVRSFVRGLYQTSNLPVIFLQGFCGDVRPLNLDNTKNLYNRFISFVNGLPPFVPFSEESYRIWVHKLNNYFEVLIKKTKKNMKINLRSCGLLVEYKKINTKKMPYNIYIQALYLGSNTLLLGVSAEVVSYYSLELKKRYPHLNIISFGYMGSVFGYWPSNKMLKEGGYEVNGFRKPFGLEGEFTKDLETPFFEAVEEILSKLGLLKVELLLTKESDLKNKSTHNHSNQMS